MTNAAFEKTISAAQVFYEANEAFENAKEALKPLAKQQLDIMARVITELDLRYDYRFRSLFYYDYIEFEVGSYYVGASGTPVIEIQLWEHGRGGNADSCKGSFQLHQHIINGEPDKFEVEFRAKYQVDADKKAIAERERTEREITALQAKLETMKGKL